MMPAGVQATRPSRFCTRRPTFSAVKPSTSLAGSMVSKTRRAASLPIAAGSGDCTRMPSIASSAFSARDQRRARRRARCVAGRWCRSTRKPTSVPCVALAADVDVRGRVVADQHEREPGRSSRPGRERLDLRLQVLAHRARQRCAVEECVRSRRSGRGVEVAVLLAVAEVDHQADGQPGGQPHPVGPAESEDHRTADEDAQRRRRTAPRARGIRAGCPADATRRIQRRRRRA